MTFLQITERFTNEVTVSSLPHPISMFILGFTLFALLMLYMEYKRTRSELIEFKSKLTNLKELINQSEVRLDTKITDISKKVDSRVDKAILSLKKQSQES